jgi:cobalt-zinc-cadmium efflux system outer membrane protein
VQFVTIFRNPCIGMRLMRRLIGVPFLFVSLYSLPALSVPLTLEQAWEQAEHANPTLRATQANLAAAQGDLADAGALLWNNPQISTERRSLNVSQTGQPINNKDGVSGLSQTFEIAGQQGIRQRAAEKNFAAIQESIAETKRQVHADVEQRFVRVLSLQLRIQTEESTLKLIEDAAKAVGKRVAAGEDSRLDGNLANVEAERAQNQVSILREQLVQARVDLSALLQMPPDQIPEVTGSLDVEISSYTLGDLLASVARRPLLNVLDYREGAARGRVELERASIYPDVTLSLRYGRELGVDNKVASLSVSLPIPLFRRNAAGIGRAETDLTQAEIEKQAASRDVRVQVVALWGRFSNLKDRVKRLKESVLPSLEENQHLSSISFREGEIGLLQLLLVNRQVLDGQRDLLDARTELRLTQVTLEAAAGWQPAHDNR